MSFRTPPPGFVNDSRRNALNRLCRAAAAGSALATAGWPWVARAATAVAANPSTSAGAEARRPRLVTVGGAITEVVYALGAQDQLAGTDTTSLFPPEAQRTAKVGYMRQLSAEGLLSLRPDVVIASAEAGPPVVLDQIRGAGIRVEIVPVDHTWDEVGRKVAAVGRAAGREDAARRLQAELDGQWQAVLARVGRTSAARAPRVLFMLAHTGSPMVSGQKTAADAVLRFAGLRNAMAGFNGYRPMTAEAMAMAAPDVVLMTTQGLEAVGGAERFWQRPELALTPAWKQRQARRTLLDFDALELLGFGPRMPDVIGRLHEQAGFA